jgi:hypothetical protein
MARSTLARTAPATHDAAEWCIALGGKGIPAGAELAEAVKTVSAVAAALRALKRKGGHEFKPADPELRVHAPDPGHRGGANWTVLVRVPDFVSARDAREAAAATAARHRGAKGVRLVALEPQPERAPVPRGRDRQQAAIRSRRTGPQHRARESLS